MKAFRNPRSVHEPLGHYTHQAELDSSERLLVLSGQVGIRPDGTVPEDTIEQMGVVFDNIFRNLEAANMAPADIVKLTYYVVGEIDLEKRRALVASRLGEHKPCSTLLFVAGLASPAYKIEIEALAARRE